MNYTGSSSKSKGKLGLIIVGLLIISLMGLIRMVVNDDFQSLFNEDDIPKATDQWNDDRPPNSPSDPNCPGRDTMIRELNDWDDESQKAYDAWDKSNGRRGSPSINMSPSLDIQIGYVGVFKSGVITNHNDIASEVVKLLRKCYGIEWESKY